MDKEQGRQGMVAQIYSNRFDAWQLHTDTAAPPAAAMSAEFLAAQPGKIVGLIGHAGYGLTRIGLTMAAAAAGKKPIAYLDVRGWLCPLAAWESGISPEQLIVVRCGDLRQWVPALTALLEGVGTIYAEVPRGVKDAQLRRISALVRSRRAAVVLRPVHGDLPSGVAHLSLKPQKVSWDGTDAGHGRLSTRSIALLATGKATKGTTRAIELEDDGINALRLVSELAVASFERPTG